CFFFFQAEDGIRYDLVTGVQTCALPILPSQLEPSGSTFCTRGAPARICSTVASGSVIGTGTPRGARASADTSVQSTWVPCACNCCCSLVARDLLRSRRSAFVQSRVSSSSTPKGCMYS